MTEQQKFQQAMLMVKYPSMWLAAYGKILTKDNQLVGLDGDYKLNEYQLKLLEVYEYCMEYGLPCRILALKPRQKGSSTVTSGILYHHSRRIKCKAIQMADRYKNSENLFTMTKRYAEHDKFPWTTNFDAKSDEIIITAKDGQEWGRIDKDTAENPRAGRSGTPQFIHVSEAAHFPSDGVKSADTTMLALLNALPDGPNTVAIVETTANGSGNWFYRHWMGDPSTGLAPAATLDQFIKGEYGNGWIKVFSPWFEFEDSKTTPIAQDYAQPLSERERYGQEVYGWSMAQIVWRRRTISSKCSGREDLFDQEFPEDEVKAFLTSGRPRFALESLRRVRMMSNRAPRIGFLHLQGEHPNRTVAWERNDSGTIQIWEEPKDGCRYLIWCDTMTGKEQVKDSKNPDRHSILVIRAGYQDANGEFHNHAVVARVRPPCTDDWHFLEPKVIALSIYYGNCLVGVEVPMGLTLVEGLRRAGITLYKRPSSTPQGEAKLGFQSNSSTKPIVIAALAKALDEPCLDIWDSHIVSELETFVVHDDGKEAAMSNGHDDDVMCLAMGISNIHAATRFVPPVVRRSIPRDMLKRRSSNPQTPARW